MTNTPRSTLISTKPYPFQMGINLTLTTLKPSPKQTNMHKGFINNNKITKTTKKLYPILTVDLPPINPKTYLPNRANSTNLSSLAIISKVPLSQLTPVITLKYVAPFLLPITSTKTKSPHYPILKSVSST